MYIYIIHILYIYYTCYTCIIYIIYIICIIYRECIYSAKVGKEECKRNANTNFMS